MTQNEVAQWMESIDVREVALRAIRIVWASNVCQETTENGQIYIRLK